MYSIDLNSDLGESFGRYTLGLDDQIIPLVSSANVACGQHAGDPMVMRDTVRMAADAGIAIGAHPGYPDLQGFGRRDMNLSPDEAYSYMLYQIGALQAFCAAAGVPLRHVKPHGQLYNHAAIDPELAAALAQAVRDVDDRLVLVGLANGALVDEGRKLGLTTAEEFFTDRNYTDEGKLVNRNDPAALIRSEEEAIERVKNAIRDGAILSVNGKLIDLHPDTICVHGDSPTALAFVRRTREALEEDGIAIKPVGATN
ncbi:LamB/YcsF family protein [Gordonibacter massiliensis (ex Traore et al. 2017)]|uniref:5-oxoprolinase subunit A n=1 Tax=Gordonibacter massiliensis (ex Traore et al. 2017) TaxID=1841863 RepID=A0A842J8T7_9ACTN|nr:5-oxoprolinase subunit PxpA [Gordonibacter massiliensis (ex Traore et al. 2017)]MBC2888442.1 LamB/YcsF family protein [Gordonibacter massiliensis (ex Traore et al. 2017)]MBX9033470.1 LamB/YcsF family protein [Gordonibacter massiliensis (ex Traore et al. 2017)]